MADQWTFSALSLSEAILWGENRPLLCVAGLVHWHVDPCCPGWCVCLPVRSLHYGFQSSQVHAARRAFNLMEFSPSFPFLHNLFLCLFSKEICEAHTTTMCPMCEETCEPWTLSDSCVYAKVSSVLIFGFFSQTSGIHLIFLDLQQT